jgi:serine/threonine protein kinase
MPDLVGEKLGRYEITARVAGGALAEVYRAYSPALGREVALKVYRPHLTADPALVERLRAEARRVAAWRHPHIAAIYDCDVATVAGQSLLYVVSELAEGATLKDRLAALKASGQLMPLADVATLVRAIAAALDYAHGRGMIHGGLKPANVLFAAAGEPMPADFDATQAVVAALPISSPDPTDAPTSMAPSRSARRRGRRPQPARCTPDRPRRPWPRCPRTRRPASKRRAATLRWTESNREQR